MTDLDAILAAIIREPAEDLHRLAFADALDERGGEGDADRAAYIRAAVGIASTWAGCDWSHLDTCHDRRHNKKDVRWSGCGRCVRRTQLIDECAALRAAHESAWRRPPCRACGGTGRGRGDYLSGRTIDHSTGAVSNVRPSWCPACHGDGHTGGAMGERVECNYDPASDTHRSTTWNIRATWTRGFISGVTLRWGQWLEWRADIRARWPVTDVQVAGAAVIPHEAVWVGANVWTDPAFPGVTFRFA